MASTSTSTGNTRKTTDPFQISEAFVRAIQTEVDAGRISSHDGTLIDSTLNNAAAIASAKYYVPFLGGGLSGGLVWSYLRRRRPPGPLGFGIVGRCAIAASAAVGFCLPPYMLLRGVASKLALLEDRHALSHVANGLDRERRKGPPIEVEGRPADNTDSDAANTRRSEDGSSPSSELPTVKESPQDRARRKWEEMLAKERKGPEDK